MFFKSRDRQVRERIRKQIENRLAMTGAPREISAFLLERWSALLAGIYFSGGDRHPDWEAGWHTVNALLWSLVPKTDRQETQQLLRLLPTLLERLQEGCEAMKLPVAERDQMFGQLAMLHAAVVRAGLQATAEEGALTRFSEETELGMGETELASLGTVAVTPADPVGTNAPVRHADIIGRLRVGDPLVFRLREGEKRLFVQWISPMGGMYLFADDQGLNALSLTLPSLENKLAQGAVWPG